MIKMIELKLIGDLTQQEQFLAAQIMAGFNPNIRDMPLEERPKDAVIAELEQLLTPGLRVVVTGLYNGKVAGVYIIPRFFRKDETLVNDVLGSYFIVEPRENGIGSEFMASLSSLFEKLADRCNAAHLTHFGRYWRGNEYLLRHGYTDRGHHVVADLRICAKEYPARPHNLSQNEDRIVEAFASMMHK